MPGIPADSLYMRGQHFMKNAYPKEMLALTGGNPAEKTLSGTGHFLINRKVLLLNHEEGELQYKMRIEVKDQKFRYWFTEFYFIPYQRNRYNSFVPVPGIRIPLETAGQRVDKKTVSKYLESARYNSAQAGNTLLYYMQAPSPSRPVCTPKRIIPGNW